MNLNCKQAIAVRPLTHVGTLDHSSRYCNGIVEDWRRVKAAPRFGRK